MADDSIRPNEEWGEHEFYRGQSYSDQPNLNLDDSLPYDYFNSAFSLSLSPIDNASQTENREFPYEQPQLREAPPIRINESDNVEGNYFDDESAASLRTERGAGPVEKAKPSEPSPISKPKGRKPGRSLGDTVRKNAKQNRIYGVCFTCRRLKIACKARVAGKGKCFNCSRKDLYCSRIDPSFKDRLDTPLFGNVSKPILALEKRTASLSSQGEASVASVNITIKVVVPPNTRPKNFTVPLIAGRSTQVQQSSVDNICPKSGISKSAMDNLALGMMDLAFPDNEPRFSQDTISRNIKHFVGYWLILSQLPRSRCCEHRMHNEGNIMPRIVLSLFHRTVIRLSELVDLIMPYVRDVLLPTKPPGKETAPERGSRLQREEIAFLGLAVVAKVRGKLAALPCRVGGKPFELFETLVIAQGTDKLVNDLIAFGRGAYSLLARQSWKEKSAKSWREESFDQLMLEAFPEHTDTFFEITFSKSWLRFQSIEDVNIEHHHGYAFEAQFSLDPGELLRESMSSQESSFTRIADHYFGETSREASLEHPGLCSTSRDNTPNHETTIQPFNEDLKNSNIDPRLEQQSALARGALTRTGTLTRTANDTEKARVTFTIDETDSPAAAATATGPNPSPNSTEKTDAFSHMISNGKRCASPTGITTPSERSKRSKTAHGRKANAWRCIKANDGDNEWEDDWE